MPLNVKPVMKLKITLTGSKPPIWRRLLVPPSTTLGDLHRIIQVSMGWYGMHLHLFQTADGTVFGDPQEDMDDMMGFRDESSIPVESVLVREKQKLRYEYDFGDGWEHEILLESVGTVAPDVPLPLCIKAMRQCPPEDVGGLGGFENFLEIMANPAHPDHEAVKEWQGGEVFDPDYVNVDAINDLIARRDELFDGDPADIELGTEAFFGLTPAQVDQLMIDPLNCPDVFQPGANESAVEAALDQSPFIRMLQALFAEIGDKGVKLTPKGNLPLRTVKAMVDAAGEEHLPWIMRGGFASLRSEEDVIHVHLTRILAEIAGFTRKYNGRILVKKPVATRIRKHGWAPIYRELFGAMMREFNWSWLDGRPDLHGIQAVAPFCLWLLSEHGDEWARESFYLDAMLQAFPMLTMESEPSTFENAEKQITRAMQQRIISLYQWAGLVEVLPDDNKDPLAYPDNTIRRTPLFETLFR